MAQRILEEIRDRDGMTHEEIVKFIVVDLRGGRWLSYYAHRGVWATNLYLNYGRLGILKQFCLKDKRGKWVLNEPIQAPFFRRKATATFNLNKERIAYEHKVSKALNRCNNQNCGTHRTPNYMGARVKAGNVCIAKNVMLGKQGHTIEVYDCTGRRHEITWRFV